MLYTGNRIGSSNLPLSASCRCVTWNPGSRSGFRLWMRGASQRVRSMRKTSGASAGLLAPPVAWSITHMKIMVRRRANAPGGTRSTATALD